MPQSRKLFVVSDVHGHFTQMKQALDAAGFDPDNNSHLLICCGDYFDRGSENFKVMQYFERIRTAVLLRGNHEDMLLKIFDTGKLQDHHYLNGTIETLTEFFGKYCIAADTVDFSGKTRILDRICEFILGTKDYFETEHYVFVHGWLPVHTGAECAEIRQDWRSATKEDWRKARWTKWTEMYETCDRLPNKTIVCGHVPSFFANKFDPSRSAENADIFYSEGLTVIDAGTFTSGKVNVLVLEDRLI